MQNAPLALRAIDAITFAGACRYRPAETTAVAWFETTDLGAVGVVVRDDRAETFAAVTFRGVGDTFLLHRRVDDLPAADVAIDRVTAMLLAGL